MSVIPERSRPALDIARSGPTRFAVAAWWVTFAVTLVAGAAALYLAVGGLREAHLYRQRTREGLKFAWVGFGLLVAHGFLGTATFAAVRLSSVASSAAFRRTFFAVAVLIVGVLAAADVLFVWVESHGERCIGSCG